MGSSSSLPDTRSCREAGVPSGGLTDTIRGSLTGINRMTIFHTTCWDLYLDM